MSRIRPRGINQYDATRLQGANNYYNLINNKYNTSLTDNNFISSGNNISIQPNDIITNGLSLYLDAGISSSYPGAGTTWNDLSGNKNNGTLINGVGYNSANGGSLSFDGANTRIIGNTPNTLNLSQPCSLNVWVYFNNFNVINPRIIEVQDNNYSIQVIRDGLTTRLATKNSNFESGTNSTSWFIPTTNIWYNIAVVWNPLVLVTSLYLNGIVQSSTGTALVGIGNQANKYVLGYRSDFYGTTQLNGNISQTSVYNRALSAAEIQQNFNATRGRFGI